MKVSNFRSHSVTSYAYTKRNRAEPDGIVAIQRIARTLTAARTSFGVFCERTLPSLERPTGRR